MVGGRRFTTRRSATAQNPKKVDDPDSGAPPSSSPAHYRRLVARSLRQHLATQRMNPPRLCKGKVSSGGLVLGARNRHRSQKGPRTADEMRLPCVASGHAESWR